MICHLSYTCVVYIFSQSVIHLYIFLMMDFDEEKFKNFVGVQIINFSFYNWCSLCLFKSHIYFEFSS